MPKPGAMAIAAALLVALAVGGLFVFPLFNAPVEPTRQAREMPPMTEMFRALPKKATPPRLMVETTHIDFGTVEGTGEAFERTLNIAVRNDGGGRAAVKRAEYHGQKGIKLGNTCAGTALAAGEACDIQVVWRPEAEGHYKGVVIVTMPDPRPADPQAPVPAGPDEGLKQIEVTAELEGAPAAPAPTGPSELELAAAAAAAARRLGRGTAHVYAEPKPGHEARAVSLSDPDYGPPKPGFGLPVDRSRVITADRYIAGVLETGINSQLGGRAVAVVSRHVFGADDRLVLIPAGTRVIGHYQPLGAQGDTRLAITWTRLIRPDGAAIALEGLPAADQMGRAGMIGRIDSRIFERYGAPLLLSAISAVAAAATQPALQIPFLITAESAAVQDLNSGLQDVTAKIIDERLKLEPIITIAAGARLHILPTHDLWLREPTVLVALPASPVTDNSKRGELRQAAAAAAGVQAAGAQAAGAQAAGEFNDGDGFGDDQFEEEFDPGAFGDDGFGDDGFGDDEFGVETGDASPAAAARGAADAGQGLASASPAADDLAGGATAPAGDASPDGAVPLLDGGGLEE